MANKGLKITLVTVGMIAAILLVFIFFGDIWLSRTVDNFLHTEFAKINTAYVNYSDLDIRIGQRAVVLNNVEFCTSPDNVLAEDSTGIHLTVDKLAIRGFRFLRMLNRKELDIRTIDLKKPDLVLHLPLKKAESQHTLVRDSMPANSALLRNIIARSISVSDGHFLIRNVSNRMHMEMENLNFKTYGLGYHFGDSTDLPDGEVLQGHVLYNDSLYDISLRNFTFLAPNGLFRADINELFTQDAGPVFIRGIHAYHTCDKGELSKRMGNAKVTWADLRIKDITSTPVNLIRQAASRNIEIDSIFLNADKVHLLRDARFPSKKTYVMPQDKLLAMNMPLLVRHITAFIPVMETEVLTTHLENCGSLEMNQVNLDVDNVCNRKGSKLQAHVHTLFGQNGDGNIYLNLHMNPAADFDFNAHATNLEGSMFNRFLHPLFGAEVNCNIHDFTTSYVGNRNALKGSFCMLYDSIHVHVTKEDAPYKAISKGAGAINLFAPMIISKSNPKHHSAEPDEYEVRSDRDTQNSFALYLIRPMIDGVMQTLLPGFVVKKIHDKQEKKQKKS